MLPLLEWLGDENSSNRDGTVIVGQKSTLELFQQEIERELASSTNPPSEPVDGKIAVLEKLAESAGLDLDVQQIEQETENLIVECLGQPGPQSQSVMRSRLQNPPVPQQGLNRHQRA